MDELTKTLANVGSGATVLGVPEVVLALLLSFGLCLALAWVYGVTHRGLSYSVGYVHTMMMMGVTTTIIMLIIGSNIARAFSLVGALSVIRFRNAVKETRDVGFLFMAMAVGMAAGTGFFWIAIVFTLFAGAMVYGLHRFEFGVRHTRELVLTVQAPEGVDHQTAFLACFERHLEDHALLRMESLRGGSLLELVWAVKMRTGADTAALLGELRQITDHNKVALLTGASNADL